MNQAEEFERRELGPLENQGHESSRSRPRNDANGFESRPLSPTREPAGRPLGAMSPAGVAGRPTLSGRPEQSQSARMTTPPPVGRALGPRGNHHAPDAQAALSAFRDSMPFLQRFLPLLDGNLANTLSNLVVSRPAAVPAIDLEPIENGLTELQERHRDLRTEIVEHHASLKRVEDHLEMVREATDRNTLEQQELIEDLKAMGSRVNAFALTLVALLVLAILLNLFLFLHIQRVLP